MYLKDGKMIVEFLLDVKEKIYTTYGDRICGAAKSLMLVQIKWKKS